MVYFADVTNHFGPITMKQAMKTAQTRERIIEAATDLFASEGLYSVTYSQIAKVVKISQPAIYRHFSDMDDLLLGACQHWVLESQRFIDEGLTGFESSDQSLKIYVEKNIRYASKNRSKWALLLGLYYYAMRSPKIFDAYKKIKDGGIDRIAKIINRGNFEKKWAASDIHEKSYFIHSILVGEIVKLIIQPQEERLDARIGRVTKEILRLLK